MKKTAQNDITGDWLHSKPNNEMFEKNFDAIFRNKNFKCNGFCGDLECPEHQDECIRINKLAEYELDKFTGEVVKKDE